MLIINKCTVDEIESSPNINELLSEYADQSSIKDMPRPIAKFPLYKQLETVGGIQSFSARLNDVLIGFITVLSTPSPHYSLNVAVIESFFVASLYRKTGAGLKLLSAAERYADEFGSSGLLVSCPTGGSLGKVVSNIGYTEASTVFFKRLK